MNALRTHPATRRFVLGLAVLLAVLTATTVTACAPAPERCLPAPLEASSTDVAPGESLTVGSKAVECDLGYGGEATYSIVMISPSGAESDHVDVPVERDGSFSADLVVPDTFPAGHASVVVSGSSYDDCGADSGSCAVYSVEVTVEH